MASGTSRANGRQNQKTRNQNKNGASSRKRIATIRNKIRRLKKHVSIHEKDKSGKKALEKWQSTT